MNPKIKKFLTKYSISLRDIKYILREEGKTSLHLADGRVISTYHTVKDFVETLPKDQFFHPNKGILISAAHVVDVHNGAYIMSDGRSFKYRVHNSQLHDIRLLSLGRRMEHIQSADLRPELPSAYFSVLDKFPLPTCVIERIVEEEDDSLGYFIVRYCNQKMLEFENTTYEEIVGKKLGSFLSYTGPHRLVAYADVALNGTNRTIEIQDPVRNLKVKLCCYQPFRNYCACVILDHTHLPSNHSEESHTLLD